MRTKQPSGTEITQSPREISRSLPGDPAAGDCPDLMSYPFFSLTPSRRIVPIHYRSGDVTITVEGNSQLGIATIWDADILLWAASQILEARDQHTGTSRLLVAHPSDILKFTGRGTSIHDNDQLRSALDRLQSTSVATSIRQAEGRRRHRFSWIGEFKEHTDSYGRSSGVSLTLPDWFYLGLLDGNLSLAFDPIYFTLKGGLARWLYRLLRFRRPSAGQFEFLHLYQRSGMLVWFPDFARHVRRMAAEQSLPGFHLDVIRCPAGQEILTFDGRRLDAPTKLPGSLSTSANGQTPRCT